MTQFLGQVAWSNCAKSYCATPWNGLGLLVVLRVTSVAIFWAPNPPEESIDSHNPKLSCIQR